MKYYYLLQKSDDCWFVEFGDYDKNVVKEELRDYRDHGTKKKDLFILETVDGKPLTVEIALRFINLFGIDAWKAYKPTLDEMKTLELSGSHKC